MQNNQYASGTPDDSDCTFTDLIGRYLYSNNSGVQQETAASSTAHPSLDDAHALLDLHLLHPGPSNANLTTVNTNATFSSGPDFETLSNIDRHFSDINALHQQLGSNHQHQHQQQQKHLPETSQYYSYNGLLRPSSLFESSSSSQSNIYQYNNFINNAIDLNIAPPNISAISMNTISSIAGTIAPNKNSTASRIRATGTGTTKPQPQPQNQKQKQRQNQNKKRFKPFHEEKWKANLKQLRAFKAKYGHCLVPHTFPNNQDLARWVKRQRRQYKLMLMGDTASTMTQERVDTLNDEGFIWDSHDVVWRERYNQLIEYKKKHGHTRVPTCCKDNPSLASWVKCQRRQYKLMWEKQQQRGAAAAAAAAAAGGGGKQEKEKSSSHSSTRTSTRTSTSTKTSNSMNAERIQLLESIGFAWEVVPRRQQRRQQQRQQKRSC